MLTPEFILNFLVCVIVLLYITHVRDNRNQTDRMDSNSQSYSSQDSKKFNKRSIEDKDYYLMTCSIVALFSWVIRRDGTIDKREMWTARLYFKKNRDLNSFLKNSQDKKEDPVLGIERPDINNCLDLLQYYNQCTNLLRYDLCCDNILRIYPNNNRSSYKRNYESINELMRALFQVAFSSDGVIGSELEILHEIAQCLQIPEDEWKILEENFGKYQASSKKYKSSKNKWEGRQNDSNRQEESGSKQQEQNMKSSTFGYKLTQAYNRLGILSTASESDVKNAYRSLVKKYHPDRLPSEATDLDRKISAEHFQLVKEAYDLICLERGL